MTSNSRSLRARVKASSFFPASVFTDFYRLPYEVRESSLKMLAAYLQLSASAAKKLAKEIDISDCVLWCFDEVEGLGDGELKRLAASVFVKKFFVKFFCGFGKGVAVIVV